MQPHVEQWIHYEYERIKQECKGNSLYGEPIDWDNHEMAVVAAYCFANHERLVNIRAEAAIISETL
jgi:hypothetical protein